MNLPELTDSDRDRYEWQMASAGVGEAGQQRLKAATVLVSRCGGVGGAIAQQLAVAGVGRLIIAHGGKLRKSDLNRQILMRDDGVGQVRVGLIERRLRELNPDISVETVEANVSEENAEALVSRADVVASAAPLFAERYAMNAAAMRLGKPLVHAAMYDFEFQVAAFQRGHSGCFQCLCPKAPDWWQRKFPVFGAVAGMTGALAAAEIIKLITGVGESLIGKMVAGDLRRSQFRTVHLPWDLGCGVCGGE